MPRPDPVRAWPFRPGARLANLVLEEELERGGMSVVWRARQGTRRGPVPCAVKTLRPELAHDPLYVRALRVEGELAQVVRHPHVVRCFGAGEHGGVPYLVLQLVEGVALHAVLRELARRRMRLPVPWVARIGERVARALHAAHTSRAPDGRPMPIVHRDVSPANVMLDTRGKLWLFDFGVAKAVVDGAERSAVFKGRVGYAAPEQLALARAHPRMDVHGLGVVLHEMLTGRRLFARAELGALRARQEGSVPPPSSFAVGIPAALDALVLACLSVDPAKRPATALEVAHRLGRLVPAVDAPTREEVRVLVEVVLAEGPASRLRALGFTSRSRGPRVALPLAPTPTEPLERVPTRPTARPPVFEPVSGAWAEDTEHEVEGARAREGPRSADETTAGLVNAGLETAGLEDAGLEDTGLENAGLEDAGPQNDGAENTGAEKTEPRPRDAKIDAESVGAREIDAGVGGPDMDAEVEANEPGDARRAGERSSPSPLSPVMEVEPPPEPAWLAHFRSLGASPVELRLDGRPRSKEPRAVSDEAPPAPAGRAGAAPDGPRRVSSPPPASGISGVRRKVQPPEPAALPPEPPDFQPGLAPRAVAPRAPATGAPRSEERAHRRRPIVLALVVFVVLAALAAVLARID